MFFQEVKTVYSTSYMDLISVLLLSSRLNFENSSRVASDEMSPLTKGQIDHPVDAVKSVVTSICDETIDKTVQPVVDSMVSSAVLVTCK
jgi:hypothetical protein